MFAGGMTFACLAWLAVAYFSDGSASALSMQDKEGSYQPGLAWILFQSPNFAKAADVGVDKAVDVDTGTTVNDYSKIWIGLLKSPSGDAVTAGVEVDDGCRLFIDNRLVIDAWDKPGSRQGTFSSKKGAYLPMRFEYFQNGGAGHIRLFWSWNGRPMELIPASAFFHSDSHIQEVTKMAQERQQLEMPPPREDHSAIYMGSHHDQPKWSRPQGPAPVSPGPLLFIDDYLIESAENVARRVIEPRRERAIPNPIVTGPGDRCFQPFFTVSRAPETGRFRIWYGAWRDDKDWAHSNLAYMESTDGIHWIRPPVICKTPEVDFGSEVIERGPQWPDPSARYVYSYYAGRGLRIAVSPDGLAWQPLVDRTVLPHDHNINNVWWDPLRSHYVATLSSFMPSPRWIGRRRTTLQSYSTDLIHWSSPAYVLYADPAHGDQGKTEFYAMSAFLVRGPLVIAMVKVLRDDIVVQGVEPGAYSRSYTTLAWSRDGLHWTRDQAPYFEPDPDPSAWDHAHAWIDEQLMFGDSLYLYYGGYKQGHKANRFTERQIGLVRILPDRYVSRRAQNGNTGHLRTVPLAVNCNPTTVSVNANAAGGVLRVQVRDVKTGKIVPGLSLVECRSIRTDGTNIRVLWGSEEQTGQKLASLSGGTIQLEFELTNAEIFAFELK